MRPWIGRILMVLAGAASALLAALWVRSQAREEVLGWRTRLGEVFVSWHIELSVGSIAVGKYRVTAETLLHEGTDRTGGISIATDKNATVRWLAEPGQRVRVWFEDGSRTWPLHKVRELGRAARWPQLGEFRHQRMVMEREVPETAAVLRREYWCVQAPIWMLIVLTGAWPVVRVGLCGARRVRSARRQRHGLCVECGYDLRGSGGKCPECGSATTHGSDQGPVR